MRIEESRGADDDFANALWRLDFRIETALAAVGLEGQHVDRDVATLSGGEATRLAPSTEPGRAPSTGYAGPRPP